MNTNIEYVYNQYIRPLTLNERVFMVQRILQDFISVQKPVEEVKTDKLNLLRKFKGIAKTGSFNLTDDDWNKQ